MNTKRTDPKPRRYSPAATIRVLGLLCALWAGYRLCEWVAGVCDRARWAAFPSAASLYINYTLCNQTRQDSIYLTKTD
jgi:hypothetical protein